LRANDQSILLLIIKTTYRRRKIGKIGATEKKYETDMENVYVRDIMKWHGKQK
jgi:hypothetical protein